MENEVITSLLLVAPTLIADGAHAGNEIWLVYPTPTLLPLPDEMIVAILRVLRRLEIGVSYGLEVHGVGLMLPPKLKLIDAMLG